MEYNIIFSAEKELYIEHLYTIEEYSTFKIKVKSGEFKGATNFCLSQNNIDTITNILSNM